MAVTMDKLRLVVLALTLVLGKTLGNQLPVVAQEPVSATLKTLEGNSTYIACRITKGNPWPTVTWTKQGSSEVRGYGEELRFDGVKKEDGGDYTCQVSNAYGTDTATFTVTVYALQVEHGFVGSRSVIRNTQSLGYIMKWYNKLFMQGEFDDPSAVVAKHYGSTTSVQGYNYERSTGNLIIPDTQLEHEGNYTFTVFDFVKTTWSFHLLNVYIAPTPVRMTGLNDYVLESNEVSVDCVVDRVKPANVTFTWTLGANILDTHQETITENGDKTFRVASRLKRSFLRRDDLEEPLRCEVTHGVDRSLKSQDEKKVVVYYKFQTEVVQKDLSSKPIEGRHKTLQCQVVSEGKPAATQYKWYRNNIDITETEGKYERLNTNELVIRNLNTADDGSYGCRIQNDAGLGIQKGTYKLEVLYAPKVAMNGPSTVQEQESVMIDCRVDAVPDFTSLQWFLNEQKLDNDGSAEYTIDKASRSDRGTYACVVTNEIGMENKTHALNVQYVPIGQPSVHPNPLLMKVDSTASLTCQTDSLTDQGNPVLSEYIWKRENVELQNTTKVIQVSPKLVTDRAVYSCAAKNTVGRSEFSQSVPVVVEAPINIEEGSSLEEYHPAYNNDNFAIVLTVSGGRNIKPTLKKSNIPVSPSDFHISTKNITGSYPFGQTSAMQITHQWKIVGKDLNSCNNVSYFNGHYYFAVEGTVAGVRLIKTKVISIKVEYPAMWKGGGSQDSAATKMNKTLLCDVCANPPPSSYIWSFGGSELPVRTREDGDRLHITNVGYDHFGTYSCTVYNTIDGKEQEKTFQIKLEERGSPHKPRDLLVKSHTSETLLVSWSVPFNGGYDLVGFEIEYKSDKTGATWTKADLTNCLNENELCEKRLVGLEPETQYSIRVRAQNLRPAVTAMDPFSDYSEVQGRTKVLPRLVFLDPEINESSLTVRWTMEGEEARRRREVADNELALEILYKKASEQDYNRYPKDENEKIPVADKSAVIPGAFDPAEPYDIKLQIYEGDQRVNALRNDMKTEPLKAAAASTGQGRTIAGVVVGLLVVILLVAGGAFFWHRRRAAKGSDVELRRKAVAGYHPVTNTASTESLPVHPPMLIPSSAARSDPETVRPPMPRPLSRQRPPPPPTQPNGQGIKESPYANVDQSGRQPAYPNTQDDNSSLYENVQKLPEYENVTFPPRSPQHPSPPPTPNSTIYTDVAFSSPAQQAAHQNAFRIHGGDDRVNYAELDFAKMAEKRRNESSI